MGQCIFPRLLTVRRNERPCPGDVLRGVRRCGKCVECRKLYRATWSGRCLLEAADHRVSSFLTLTYRDDPGALPFDHIPVFCRELRRSGEFRFFVVGEYGERRGRAHWHMLLFGRSFPDGLLDVKEWPHGHCFSGSVTPASVTYTLSYMLKNASDDREKARSMSRRPYGIGIRAVEEIGTASALKGYRCPVGMRVGDFFYPFDRFARIKAAASYLAAGGKEAPKLYDSHQAYEDYRAATDNHPEVFGLMKSQFLEELRIARIRNGQND